ncbi:MAG TPA: WD40 repeat domain-containing protein [Longimicrobiaceae bacterium]|nr:WD40 repeat domain-containing protein [Longimicrobiaceae bacterium]
MARDPLEGGSLMRRALQDYLRFLREDAPVLADEPSLLFQQAANRHERAAPARDAAARYDAGRMTRPWLRRVDHPLDGSACLATLTEHPGRILGMAFSPDGRTLATASTDAAIVLWDAEDGVPLLRLEGHRGPVRAVAFSSDGHRIASASADRTVRVWDPSTGDPLATLRGHTSEVTGCAFAPDGRRLASSSRDGTLRVWDSGSGQKLARRTGHRHVVESCAWSPDGSTLVSGSWGEIRLWDAASGAVLRTLDGHAYLISACLFSPDGRRIASVSVDGTLIVRDAGTGDPLAERGHTGVALWGLAFSPDGAWILTVSEDGFARLRSGTDGSEIASIGAHAGGARACAFAPDGSRFATAGVGEVRLWEPVARSDSRVLLEDRASSAEFSRDGKWIATTDTFGAAIRSGETGRALARVRQSQWIKTCAFSPDGRRMATGSADETVGLWRVPSGEPIATLVGHMGEVQHVAFSPDGTRVLSQSDDFGRLSSLPRGPNLWDPGASVLIRRLAGFRLGGVSSDMFSPDGELVLIADDRELCLVNSATGATTSRIGRSESSIYDYAFSSSGARIVWGGGSTVTLTGVKRGEKRLPPHAGDVVHCGFSPDGTVAFSREKEGPLRLWDASSGRSLGQVVAGGNGYAAWASNSDASRIAVEVEDRLAFFRRDGDALREIGSLTGATTHRVSPGAEFVAVADRRHRLAVHACDGGALLARFPIERPDLLGWGPDGVTLAVSSDRGFRLLRLMGVRSEARPEAPLPLPAVIAWQEHPGSGLQLGCPLCQERIELPASERGGTRRCAWCGEEFRVDPRVAPGRLGERLTPEEQIRRKEERERGELFGMVETMARDGLFERVEAMFDAPSGSAGPGTVRDDPPPKPKKPWWKPW